MLSIVQKTRMFIRIIIELETVMFETKEKIYLCGIGWSILLQDVARCLCDDQEHSNYSINIIYILFCECLIINFFLPKKNFAKKKLFFKKTAMLIAPSVWNVTQETVKGKFRIPKLNLPQTVQFVMEPNHNKEIGRASCRERV